MADAENVTSSPSTTAQGRQRMEFPANIAVRVAVPIEGFDAPKQAQVVMWEDRLPFLLVVQTPDPVFIERLAGAFSEIAAELRANPANAASIGKHEAYIEAQVDPNTLEPVASADGDGTKNVDSPLGGESTTLAAGAAGESE